MLFGSELVLRLTIRHDPHPELFDDYARTLQRLGDADLAWTLRRFERDLLAHLGYGLALDVDAAGDVPLVADRIYGYRADLGIVPWSSSADGPKLNGAALLAFAADRAPSGDDLPGLRRLMKRVIASHLDGKDLRAWSMLKAAPLRRRTSSRAP